MHVIALVAGLLFAPARAAEVVWLDPAPTPEEAERVGAAAGATRGPLTPLDLRAAATAWSPADDAAYRLLDDTLRDVRAFETRLDGELLIMRDLDRPIEAISIVRGEADRERLFAALAYQGFAVDRFFMEELERDDRAMAYRTVVSGTVVERPWLDAVALDPEREVTPYDVAEAPQRVAYEEVRKVVSGALPAEIRAPGFPADMTMSIDGRVPRPTASGGYRVVPGRHIAHAEKDGVVVARWDLRLDAGSSVEITLPISDADYALFLTTARAGNATVPDGLRPSLTALGGEVWFAQVDERGEVTASKLTEAGQEPVELPREEGGGGGASKFSITAVVGAGWMYSGDFYTQDPANAPHDKSTVNAATTTLGADFTWDIRWFRAVGGIDFLTTYGDFHYALTGTSATRVRPNLYVGAGLKWVQITVGFLFPYHPSVALQGSVPLFKGLEVRANVYIGNETDRPRSDGGDPYHTEPILGVWGGVAYRFAVGKNR